VRVVAAGDALISPGMTRRLVAEFAARAKEPTGGAVGVDLAGRAGPARLADLTIRTVTITGCQRSGPGCGSR
jgi:hypothetical protein